MHQAPRIWGLLDDKAGHANQVRGLIEALSIPAQSISFTYNLWAKLPNALLGATIRHLTRDCREELKAQIAQNMPTLVIACGRRTEPVARHIKRMHPQARIIYIMRPSSMDGWDCVIVPQHDNVMRHWELSRDPRVKPEDDKEIKPEDDKEKRSEDDTSHKNDSRIIESLMPLHRVNDAALAQAKMRYEQLFAHYPHPRIGVLMGDMKDASTCVAAMAQLAGENGSLLVSTSRRTAPHIAQALKKAIKKPHYFYDAHAPMDADNPYMGMLAHADRLIVSGDSLSMCAEAVATGKPVYIDDSDKALPKKHRAMHQALYKKGIAVSLSQALSQASFSFEPSNEMEKIAAELRARFLF